MSAPRHTLKEKPDFYEIRKVLEPSPLAYVAFKHMPKKNLELAEFDYFMHKLDKLFPWFESHAPGQSFAIVFDTQMITENPNADFAKMIGAWMDRNRPKIEKHLHCTGILVKSRLIQLFLNMLFKFKKTARPAQPFRSTPDMNAMDKCTEWISSVKPPGVE